MGHHGEYPPPPPPPPQGLYIPQLLEDQKPILGMKSLQAIQIEQTKKPSRTTNHQEMMESHS